MARALRVVSVERGRDPRGLTLVAFGGAGPLHAPTLAADLGVPRVLVPRAAGVLSALGLLAGDIVYDRSTSMVRPWGEIETDDLESALRERRERGDERLDVAGVPEARRSFERYAALRYRGQSYSLDVSLDGLDRGEIAERFHARHRERYGYADPEEPLELVTLRVRARGRVDPPELAGPAASGSLADARRETRTVGFEDGDHETPVYGRADVPAGAAFDGPALIAGSESTAVVPPGDTGRVDEDGNLLVEVSG
jgi:N-methylhydantoinase A